MFVSRKVEREQRKEREKRGRHKNAWTSNMHSKMNNSHSSYLPMFLDLLYMIKVIIIAPQKLSKGSRFCTTHSLFGWFIIRLSSGYYIYIYNNN